MVERYAVHPEGREPGYFVPQAALMPLERLPRPLKPGARPHFEQVIIEVHPSQPSGCGTCGAEPIGTFNDGSPRYDCVHPPYLEAAP
jgi:hypothetical protein